MVIHGSAVRIGAASRPGTCGPARTLRIVWTEPFSSPS